MKIHFLTKFVFFRALNEKGDEHQFLDHDNKKERKLRI